MTAPWITLTEDLEAKQELERTADCASRYLEELIHKGAFRYVRTVIRDATVLMEETIDALEDDHND